MTGEDNDEGAERERVSGDLWYGHAERSQGRFLPFFVNTIIKPLILNQTLDGDMSNQNKGFTTDVYASASK